MEKLAARIAKILRTIATLIKPSWKIAMLLNCLLALLMMPAYALSPPTISPAAAASTTPVSVTMVSGTIYYTLDGSQPTNASLLYTGAITISSPTQINAVAFSSPSTYSTVATAYIDVEPGIAPVVANGVTPILWLRSSLGIGTNTGSPSPVNSWIDLSGNGNSATTNDYATYPVLQPNVIQGAPVVTFSGGQFLQIQFPSDLSDFTTNGGTFFIVAAPSALTPNARILDLGDAASGNNILFQISSSGSYGQFWTYSSMSGTYAQSASPLQANQYQLLEAVLAPGTPTTTGTFYVNGVPGTANASMNNISTPRTSDFLGQASSQGNLYDGSIIEVVGFASELTAAQRQAIEAMLMQKYGIQSQVPETPSISVASGTLLQPAQVSIAADPAALTTYTTDGSVPTQASTAYQGCPININYSQTLNVVSFKNGSSSGVASATYFLNPTLFPKPSSTDMTTPTLTPILPTPSM